MNTSLATSVTNTNNTLLINKIFVAEILNFCHKHVTLSVLPTFTSESFHMCFKLHIGSNFCVFTQFSLANIMHQLFIV